MYFEKLSYTSSVSSKTASPPSKSKSSFCSTLLKSDTNNVDIFDTNLNENIVSYEVQAFYYPWYCNPQVDADYGYMHWNHKLIKHWKRHIADRYSGMKQQHDPDKDDIGASFYPLLGTYSSSDKIVICQHMQMLRRAGIGVAIVSWLPIEKHDDNGPPISPVLGLILDIALEYNIKITIHMEPYEGRTLQSLRHDIVELLDEHVDSPALYRLPRPTSDKDNMLPLLYFYDQYQVDKNVWKQLFTDDASSSSFSIRGTKYDAVALALIVERAHWDEYVVGANFDGGYTYFASDKFSFGSNPRTWQYFQSLALRDGKLFVPSLGPGYDDTRVRPWNSENSKERSLGSYFDNKWDLSIKAKTAIVSITSFNEWHEGTQIEPAIPKQSLVDGWKYRDYEQEGGPYFYLDRNYEWVQKFITTKAID